MVCVIPAMQSPFVSQPRYRAVVTQGALLAATRSPLRLQNLACIMIQPVYMYSLGILDVSRPVQSQHRLRCWAYPTYDSLTSDIDFARFDTESVLV